MTMTEASDYPKGYRFPKLIISHAVWLYHRFTLSYRDVQELLFQRGIDVSHESIRSWCLKFGSDLAEHIKRRRMPSGRIWHLDEVSVVIGARFTGFGVPLTSMVMYLISCFKQDVTQLLPSVSLGAYLMIMIVPTRLSLMA